MNQGKTRLPDNCLDVSDQYLGEVEFMQTSLE